jgi:aminoglycoside phosphotransferase (APT) family kinase protein
MNANVGTIPVRAQHQFREDALHLWMQAHVASYEGPLKVDQFSGGQSNPTYRLSTPKHQYVLRRKPPGDLLKGAHAVDREARVLHALAAQGFPVPRVYGVCQDDAVIGTWFYVMEMVRGRIFWDATFAEVSQTERPRFFDAMNATLARLHSIDPVAAGLSNFGRPDRYFERQIARWSEQYLADVDAGRDPNMDRMLEWLPDHIPPGEESRVVHGDFRCDNMIFHAERPEVIAVLDWELSTLGHPLADFAYHLMMYRLPPLGIAGLKGADLPRLNIPAERDYVEAYCRRTGRSGVANLNFYLAFNVFRFSAIVHGIKGRVLRGTASSPNSQTLVQALPQFAAIAWKLAAE